MQVLSLPSCTVPGKLISWSTIDPTATNPSFSLYRFREVHAWNTTAFCRLFSQWRQNGVRSISVEELESFPEAQSEDETLQRVLPGKFLNSRLLRVTAFNCPCPVNQDIYKLPENACMGFCIVKENRFAASATVRPIVFESVTPHNRHPSSFPTCAHDFVCMPLGRPFSIRGLYYCQQNGVSNVCVHAAIKMLAIARSPSAAVSYDEIDSILGTSLGGPEDLIKGRRKGLYTPHIEAFLDAKSIPFSRFSYRNDNAKGHPFISSAFPFYKYLYAAVEMGCPALLVFRSSNKSRHVVTVLGHTFNEDAYRPIAEIGYNRLSSKRKLGYMPSESWMSNFIIHDDNFGGEHCLPVHYLNPLRVSYVVATMPSGCRWDPKEAELEAVGLLYRCLDQIAGIPSFSPWYRRLSEARANMAVAFRTVHVSREQYLTQLQNPCHTGDVWPTEALEPAFLKSLQRMLPKHFYACEFSLPDLFSANRRKLGEILFCCDRVPKPSGDATVIIGLRAPGLWFAPSGTTLWPEMATGISNHLPLLCTHGECGNK